MNQDMIVFGIVSLVFAKIGIQIFRKFLAGFLSEWLLKCGKIKWAIWVRGQISAKTPCSNCKCS